MSDEYLNFLGNAYPHRLLAAKDAEIERLRAALREIREHCANTGQSEVTRERIIDCCDATACAALAGRDEPTGLCYRGG